MSKQKQLWVCFTPGDTYIYETEARTEAESWAKLLKAASHMPYDGIEGFKQRGYECVLLQPSPQHKQSGKENER